MASGPQEAERNSRRQRVQRRFAIVGLPLAMSGALARLALDAEWGWGLMSAGFAVDTLGFAVAPLLHPKPLSEH